MAFQVNLAIYLKLDVSSKGHQTSWKRFQEKIRSTETHANNPMNYSAMSFLAIYIQVFLKGI